MVSVATWRWVFLLVVPFGLAAALAVPRDTEPTHRAEHPPTIASALDRALTHDKKWDVRPLTAAIGSASGLSV